MTEARDCRNCAHNSYLGIPDWVLCGHPTTLAKMPKPFPGDPAWVDMMTGDLPVERLSEVADCPAWEQAEDSHKRD